MHVWRVAKPMALSLFLALVALGGVFALAEGTDVHDAAPVATFSTDASILPSPAGEIASSSADGGEGVRIVASDERGLVLELLTPAFHIEQASAEDGPCAHLVVDGYAETDTGGRPALPVKGAMVGVPVSADVSLTVLETDAVVLAERYDLCPVSSPIVEVDLAGEIHFQGTARVRDAQAYAVAEFFPSAPAEMVSTGFIRSQRVAQVRFHPFQYNPVSGEVRHLQRIRIRLGFDSIAGSVSSQSTDLSGTSEPFEDVLQRTLVNYEDARRWRAAPQPAVSMASSAATQALTRCRIVVGQSGLYQITQTYLFSACMDLTGVDPHTFRLTNQGQEIAIHVEGEADGSFDPGDALLFYGEEIDTKYTDENVYWLTWGGAEGLRMSWVDGTPSGGGVVPSHFLTTRRFEQDEWYYSNLPCGPDHDRWYWYWVVSNGSPATTTFSVQIDGLAATPLSATVQGFLRGLRATSEHHTRVYLNGHLIDDATWPPLGEHSFEEIVPQSYLTDGVNVISVVSGIGNVQDYVLVDEFRIDYYATYTAVDDVLLSSDNQTGTREYHVTGFTTETLELLDITALTQPIRVLSATIQPGGGAYTLTFQQTISEERRYLAQSLQRRRSPLHIERDAPSDLHATTNGADYIIVTHGDFVTAVEELAVHRKSQGLRTVVVDVQDVYDEFSYGIFDPEAIRAFLTYAYGNWVPPAPAYVLLVGDGHYDFKAHKYDESIYIPPYLADVDSLMGETAADNRYVCVSGEDIFPDMHLGRFPVKTSVQAGAMVAKVLAYERSPAGGDWNQQVLFVADDYDPKTGDFAAFSDDLVDHYLPAPYAAEKIYYKVTHFTDSAARTAVKNAINGGKLLVNYIGHGTIQFWGAERYLSVGTIGSLTNTSGRLPLMVPMTCLEGYYIAPGSATNDTPCLAESIVRVADRGAIASWSPTGAGTVEGHHFLNKGLFEALFFDGVIELGPATTQGKLYLYSNTAGHRDLLDTYILFGDPALRLNVLPADVGITKAASPAGVLRPNGLITYTLIYSNAGPATAHNVVITDILPPALISPTVVTSGAIVTPRAGARFVWDVAPLAQGEGGSITIRAVVSPTFAGVITNTASIAATVIESDAGDNSAETAATVALYTMYFPIAMKGSE